MELTSDSTAYQIQGIDALQMTQDFGTPLYIYDAAVIEKQYRKLEQGFKKVEKLKINYAVKALTNISVLSFVKSLGAGADAVSIEEVQICLRAGFEAQEIGYTPSNVAWSEIQAAVELGVKIHLDSLPLLQRFGEVYGNSYPIGIRINPHVMAGGNLKISTGHEGSKFGISIEQLPQILNIIAKTGLIVEGLHQHTGSDIKEANTFLEVADILFKAALQFPDLQYLDFGGGFKVAYQPDEKSANLDKLGSEIADKFNDFCEQYGRTLALTFEPGKWLVSEAGYFFTSVNWVKENPSITFACVDSGLNHLIRPMMYDAYHHILNVSNPKGNEQFYTVAGYVCETDNFAENRLLPHIRPNDVLCLLNAGAYGFTMASQYNARPRPAEVLVLNGEAHLVRRRETLEDILRGQILVTVNEMA